MFRYGNSAFNNSWAYRACTGLVYYIKILLKYDNLRLSHTLVLYFSKCEHLIRKTYLYAGCKSHSVHKDCMLRECTFPYI